MDRLALYHKNIIIHNISLAVTMSGTFSTDVSLTTEWRLRCVGLPDLFKAVLPKYIV